MDTRIRSLVTSFLEGQSLADEGDLRGAVAAYGRGAKLCEGLGADERRVASIIELNVRNARAEVLSTLGRAGAARAEFEESASACPTLAAIPLLNLAHLEREHDAAASGPHASRHTAALERAVAADGGDSNDLDDAESPWPIESLEDARTSCRVDAAYLLALDLCRRCNDDERERAGALLYDLGYRWRLAPPIWAAAIAASAEAPRRGRRSAQRSAERMQLSRAKRQRLERAPIIAFNAVPRALGDALRSAFAPNAAFWSETNYRSRGYFSFWSSLLSDTTTSAAVASSTAVDRLVAHLLPLATAAAPANTTLVGAEWWTHSRPLGRNIGHQLHFDMDERFLHHGIVRHPVVSTVVYLSDAPGGATLVLDQGFTDTEFAHRGWVASAERDSVLMFQGDRLHGVLPANLASSPPPTSHRLTLMIGWWAREAAPSAEAAEGEAAAAAASVGARRAPSVRSTRLGACAPVPHHSRTQTWPSQLSWTVVNEKALQRELAKSPRVVIERLPQVEPAWERVAPESESGDEDDDEDEDEDALEPSVDQRFFVRSVASLHKVTC